MIFLCFYTAMQHFDFKPVFNLKRIEKSNKKGGHEKS